MNKYLYEKALGYYTSNASEIVNDILDNNDWSNVEIWQPFETWSVEEVKELVDNLYEDFLEVQGKEEEIDLLSEEDIIFASRGLGIPLSDDVIQYVMDNYRTASKQDLTTSWELVVENLLHKYCDL